MPNERVRKQFRDWCRNEATDAQLEYIADSKTSVAEDVQEAMAERGRRREMKENRDRRFETVTWALSFTNHGSRRGLDNMGPTVIFTP